MATVQASWLQQGFFVLGNGGLMPSVREELQRGLGLPEGTFHIAQYPPNANWKHTCWWREGDIEYAEAQFFAQIAQDYPVLSLGVSIEKGFESATYPKGPKRMVRRVWDWPRLIASAERLLSHDLVSASADLGKPIHVRVRRKHPLDDEKVGWYSRAFSFTDDSWFERYVGKVDSAEIVSALHELDANRDSWGIVHFARDFSPVEADGLEASQIATTLVAFDKLRRKLRGASAVRTIAV